MGMHAGSIYSCQPKNMKQQQQLLLCEILWYNSTARLAVKMVLQ
jgi:hypothetical protein